MSTSGGIEALSSSSDEPRRPAGLTDAQRAALLDRVVDLLLVVTANGSVRYANETAVSLLGWTPGDPPVDLLSLVHPDDRRAVVESFQTTVAAETHASQQVTVRLRAPSGDWLSIEARIINQVGVDGIDALVVHGRDVTVQHRAEVALRARVDADELVAKIAARFVDVSAEAIPSAVAQSLEEFGIYCGADRAWIFQLHADGRHIDYAYEWCGPGISSEIDQLEGFPIRDLPGFADWIGDPEPLLIRSVAGMDDSLAAERQVLREQGIKSLAAQAMFVHGELYGLIGLDAVVDEVIWPDHVVWALSACANIFGSALRRCEAETALAMNETRFRAMYEHAADGVRVLDADLRTIYASPAVERITGYGIDDLADPGLRLLLVHPDDRDAVERRRAVVRGSSSGEIIVGDYRMQRPDGSWVHIEETSTNLLDDPAVRGLVMNMRDVTDRHAYEAELLSQARRDPITGLANRLLFEELLDAAMARRELTGSRLAVLALDLDRFRLVNESLGLPTGDAVLDAAAKRLRSALRGGDVVARLSADEFVILCEPVESDHEITDLAESLLTVFRTPFAVKGETAYATVSIGVAITDTRPASRAELMREADAALHAAKRAGGNRAVLFDGGLVDTSRARLDLEVGLRGALVRGEFELAYQPIIDLASGQVHGAEALLRWRHPTRGVLGPGAFLDVCEETGLISPLGAWVIAEACDQLADWRRRSIGGDDLTMHVNVSVRQLVEGGVAATFADVLAGTDLDPACLYVEITESALLAGEGPINELEAIRAFGVRVALDDFGTGHSPLTYLRHLRIDVLKIDRQFVDGLTGEGSDAAIVAAIINLASSLELVTVGEGVETAEQVDALRSLGCEHVQGYWYAHPLTPEEFEVFVAGAGDR